MYERYKDTPIRQEKFNYNYNELWASAYDRNLISAQAFMVGMYDFGSLNEPLDIDEKFKKPEWAGFNIQDDYETALPHGFQPVPVHSSFINDNYVLGTHTLETCPKIFKRKNSDSKLKNEIIEIYVNE